MLLLLQYYRFLFVWHKKTGEDLFGKVRDRDTRRKKIEFAVLNLPSSIYQFVSVKMNTILQLCGDIALFPHIDTYRFNFILFFTINLSMSTYEMRERTIVCGCIIIITIIVSTQNEVATPAKYILQ